MNRLKKASVKDESKVSFFLTLAKIIESYSGMSFEICNKVRKKRKERLPHSKFQAY